MLHAGAQPLHTHDMKSVRHVSRSIEGSNRFGGGDAPPPEINDRRVYLCLTTRGTESDDTNHRDRRGAVDV